MHELGITQEIVDIVSERAEGRKVRRIVLEIGKLSCIMPDAVRSCFDLCSEGTVAEGAELEIAQPAGVGRCRQCGADVVMLQAFARCDCGGSDLEWISGEELKIKAMEMA